MSQLLTSYRKRLLVLLVAVAALGAVGFLVFNDDGDPADDAGAASTGGIHSKGPANLPGFHLVRQVNGQPVKAVSGDQFKAGEVVGFMVDLNSAANISVYGVKESDEIYTAWPLEPNTSTVFPAGQGIELPGTLQLDDSTGIETMMLVACQADGPPPKCTLGKGNSILNCPLGCSKMAFTYEKLP